MSKLFGEIGVERRVMIGGESVLMLPDIGWIPCSPLPGRRYALFCNDEKMYPKEEIFFHVSGYSCWFRIGEARNWLYLLGSETITEDLETN
ncbi:hypothetical protein K2173_020985 [Erythroxylum novogranatense]|uniref:DUF5348 domain-containing protein n=1 Tax=Erythroxylum novogranatense TaxID=1862640 RepID=A0AAV8TPX5_9ROSI|nr:hypothetical protein K2173_020985 [Erythroxylum novogranatense]